MLSTLTAIYAPRLFALLTDRKGVSSLEYAVLAVGIVAAVAAGALTVGGDLTKVFTNIGTELTAAG